MIENNLYAILKALHLIAVISWMAGLLYLPRLFVYHCQAKQNSQLDKTLQIMEKKLLRIIMNPAMILTFVLGFWLIHYIGFDQIWVHIKMLLVILMAIFHGFLAKCRKNFTLANNKYSEKFYRIINEIPTLLMIVIVFLAILKPF